MGEENTEENSEVKRRYAEVRRSYRISTAVIKRQSPLDKGAGGWMLMRNSEEEVKRR